MIDRLGEISESAQLDRARCNGHVGRPGYQHNRDVEVHAPGGQQELDAVHPGHRDITDQDIEGARFQRARRDLPVVCGLDDVSKAFQRAGERAQQGFVVVDEQNPPRRFAGRG